MYVLRKLDNNQKTTLIYTYSYFGLLNVMQNRKLDHTRNHSQHVTVIKCSK